MDAFLRRWGACCLVSEALGRTPRELAGWVVALLDAVGHAPGDCGTVVQESAACLSVFERTRSRYPIVPWPGRGNDADGEFRFRFSSIEHAPGVRLLGGRGSRILSALAGPHFVVV